jgi:transposase
MENTFIGIDVSSKTLDICVRVQGINQSCVIKNSVKEINRFFKKYNHEYCYLAMENTGRYNWLLYDGLSDFKGHMFVIPPLHLKKSLGLTRGKNDKIDAIRIVQFIEKNHQDLKRWQPMPQAIKELKILLSERNLRIKQKKQLNSQQATYDLLKSGLTTGLQLLNQKMVKALVDQIRELEKEIQNLIQQDDQLTKQASLIGSVPGVGKVLTWSLLSVTEGFQKITEARKLACYAGVVPFEHQSGTSIRGKTRVSVFADKKLKSILHMAALRAVCLNNDLRDYYLRKTQEGKNKMTVLNAVRNKIVHRAFAVIKQQRPYVPNLVLS